MKYVHIGAAKTVDRLLAIADDEEIRVLPLAGPQNELLKKRSLQAIGVLKLIDEEKPVTLGLRAITSGRLRAPECGFEIVEIERRQLLLLFVEPSSMRVSRIASSSA